MKKPLKIAQSLFISMLLLINVGCNKEVDADDDTSTPPTPPVATTATDIDGNVYNTVTIGTQTWMKENLKVTKFNNGTSLPMVVDHPTWMGLTTPAYCWYNDDYNAYGVEYGALYNGYAINSGNLAPAGWHVATEADWDVLSNYLGGNSVSGGKLKEVGFTALGGGYRSASLSSYTFNKETGLWWTSTSISATQNTTRAIYYDINDLQPGQYPWATGCAVRCVKD